MLPGAQAAAALAGSSNPESGSCCCRQAPCLLPCSWNTPGKACTACFPWQRAGSLQGSCPALGHPTQQGLSSAQPCVRGAEAEAEGVSDLFRMVGVPVVPRPALLLCLLMEHRPLYASCCWAKSLFKSTQHLLP